jgi:hypothetical protein
MSGYGFFARVTKPISLQPIAVRWAEAAKAVCILDISAACRQLSNEQNPIACVNFKLQSAFVFQFSCDRIFVTLRK